MAVMRGDERIVYKARLTAPGPRTRFSVSGRSRLWWPMGWSSRSRADDTGFRSADPRRSRSGLPTRRAHPLECRE